jgi:hypothetical protein
LHILYMCENGSQVRKGKEKRDKECWEGGKEGMQTGIRIGRQRGSGTDWQERRAQRQAGTQTGRQRGR